MTADNTQVGGTHYTSKSIQPWDAVRRVCELVEHYAGRGYPRSDEIAKLHAIKYISLNTIIKVLINAS